MDPREIYNLFMVYLMIHAAVYATKLRFDKYSLFV